MPTTPRIRLFLKALSFNNFQSFNADNIEEVKGLVSWLENLKIRRYAIEDREVLNNPKSPNWSDAFEKYLRDLACPLVERTPRPSWPAIVDWLLSHAVGCEYPDAMDAYKKKGGPAAAAALGGGGEEFEDIHSPALRASLESLAVLLQMSVAEGTSTGKLLQDVLGSIQRIPFHLFDAKPGADGGSKPSPLVPSLQALNRENFPLGFSTGDEAVNSAATVLRVLYIADLRQLQSLVDRLIVAVQEYSANPITDTKLGRVGR